MSPHQLRNVEMAYHSEKLNLLVVWLDDLSIWVSGARKNLKLPNQVSYHNLMRLGFAKKDKVP